MSPTPVLCRLCECPVADGGVRVNKLDAEKLTEWWFCKLDAEFDAESSKNARICQFCLWSARFEHEHSNEESLSCPVDWWCGNDGNQTYYKYYQDEIIKQCSVNLGGKISIQDDTLSADADLSGTVNLRNYKRASNLNCVYCSDQFPYKRNLKMHVSKMHANIKTFICHDCTVYFSNDKEKQKHNTEFHLIECIYCKGMFKKFYNLAQHIKSMHQKDKIYQCNINGSCRKYFRTEQERLEHIQLRHAHSAMLNCFHCKFSFSSRQAFKKHLDTYHSGQYVQCGHAVSSGQCLEIFLTEDEKSKHVFQEHQKIASNFTKCNFCSKVVSMRNLLRHKKRCPDRVILKRCSNYKCVTFFSSDEEKQKHEKRFHWRDEIKMFKCIFCNQIFYCRFYYAQHMKSSHKSELPNAFRCTSKLCVRYYLTEADLEEHISNEHVKNMTMEKVMCIYCTKYFRASSMKMHMKNKHSDVQIKCKFKKCGLYFHTQSELDQHQRLHHDRKTKFQCSECNHISGTKLGLSWHFNRMHGLNKQQCPKCPKSCATRAGLKKHLLHHGRITKFQCSECNHKSGTKLGLSWHFNRMHGLNKHPCPKCPKSCATRAGLKKHLRKIHTM